MLKCTKIADGLEIVMRYFCLDPTKTGFLMLDAILRCK